MAELDDDIKLSQETLMAPLVLAKNLEEVYNVALKISASKGVETSINSTVTATKKLRDETTKLNRDTQALVTVQKALATAVAADSKALEQENKILSQLNSTSQTQLATNDRQVKNLKDRRAELDANRGSLAKMNTEQLRASKDGQDLSKTIQQQDETIRKLTLDLLEKNKVQQKETSALTQLKQKYKELQSEMLKVGDTAGVESEEFVKLAQEAGDVRDKMSDLSEATKSVSGEPIERFSGSVGLLKGKLSALDLKGATTAIKGMANASKDLTFKSAISGAGGLTKAVGTLGKALLANPIFLIVAIVVGIGIALYELKDRIKVVSAAFDAFGEVLDYVIQLGKDYLDFLGLTTFAIDDMTEKIVKDLDKQRAKWEQLYDDQIKLLSAAGKSTIEAEKAKQKAIAETSAMAIARLKEQERVGSALNPEQKKQLDELIKINHDANIELTAIYLKAQKEKDDIAKEDAKKTKEARLREEGDAFKLQQFLLQNEIEKNKKIAASDTETYDARFDAVDKLIAKQKELALIELDQSFNAEGASNSAKKLAQAKYQQDLTDIAAEGEAARLAIIKSNQLKAQENVGKSIEEKKKQYALEAQAQQNALDQQLQAYRDGLVKQGLAKKDIDDKVAKQEKLLVDEHIQAEIDLQRKILNIDELSGDDRAAAEQKLIELKLKLNDAYYAQLEDKEKSWSQKSAEFIDKYIGAYQQFTAAIGDIFAGGTAKRLQELDKEKDANDELRDTLLEQSKEDQESAIKAAGDNAEAVASIKEAFAKRDASIKEQAAKKDEQLEQRKRKEQQKQAKLDKAIALSIGAIKLAGAILAMLSVGPAGFALAAVAAAIGAVQLAAIAAQPIPAAEKGLLGHKGGKVLAGEVGHELIEEPGGKLSFTDSQPHIYDLPAGTNIYAHNHPKTIGAMATKSLPIRKDRSRSPVTSNTDFLLGKLIKTVKSKPSTIVKGVVVGSVRHNTTINDARNG